MAYRRYGSRFRRRTYRRKYTTKRKFTPRRTVRRLPVRMPKAAYRSVAVARAKGTSQDTLLMKNLIKLMLVDKVKQTPSSPVPKEEDSNQFFTNDNIVQ